MVVTFLLLILLLMGGLIFFTWNVTLLFISYCS